MKVLIVDDHPLFRKGLAILLEGLEPDIEVLEAGSVQQALALAGDGLDVDLLLLDLGLPNCSEIDALNQVKTAFEGTPIVIVSGEEKPQLMRAAIEGGASGYVPKSSDGALTAGALRVVLAHGVYLPARLMLSLPEAQAAAGAAPASAAPVLSTRQRAVLMALLQGKSNKLIARELSMAEGTVKAHLWAVYQALGVTSRTMAMFRAHELGLFETPPIDADSPWQSPRPR